MIKERKILTWEELANKINQMSPEERKESVKVWGDERPLCDDVCLTKEDEDLCYDEDWPEDGCYVSVILKFFILRFKQFFSASCRVVP